MSDDEIVDAEIVESNELVLRPGSPVDSLIQFLTEESIRREGTVIRNDTTLVAVPLSFLQRQLLREALTHYHDKGPRVRSTSRIMDLLNYMADIEPDIPCGLCNNTGRVRGMYGVDYCSCRRGMEVRSDGKSNNDLY